MLWICERGDLAPGLPPLALGVALEDVLDDEGDVGADEPRPDEEQHAPHRAHRADEGEGGRHVGRRR